MIKKNSSLQKNEFSNNVNEVIRAVSNLFIFFYGKSLLAQKVQRRNQAKAQKA